MIQLKGTALFLSDPIKHHVSHFGKCMGSNKRSVPNKHTVSSNWNTRVACKNYSFVENTRRVEISWPLNLCEQFPVGACVEQLPTAGPSCRQLPTPRKLLSLGDDGKPRHLWPIPSQNKPRPGRQKPIINPPYFRESERFERENLKCHYPLQLVKRMMHIYQSVQSH